MLVTYMILSYNRRDDLIETIDSLLVQDYEKIEIVVVDNNSTDGTVEMVKQKYPMVRLIASSVNTGVTGGRNIGAENSSGEIVVMIDDDSIIKDKKATQNIVQYFKEDENLGVLGFKVINYFTEQLTSWHYPLKGDEWVNKSFETCYFPGGGMAFRKSILDKMELFPDDYFYSTEEIHFAYRVIDAGYSIKYTPKVVIWHKISPLSRPNWRRHYYDLRNHLLFALELLPLTEAIKHITLWVGFSFLRALKQGFTRYFFKAIFDGVLLIPAKLKKRKPLQRETVIKLKQLRNKGWI